MGAAVAAGVRSRGARGGGGRGGGWRDGEGEERARRGEEGEKGGRGRKGGRGEQEQFSKVNVYSDFHSIYVYIVYMQYGYFWWLLICNVVALLDVVVFRCYMENNFGTFLVNKSLRREVKARALYTLFFGGVFCIAYPKA